MKKSNSLYQNSFSEEARAFFDWNYNCWICHRSDRGLSPDHILGRKKPIHSSILNLAPLCIPCHQNKTSHDKPKLLKRTLTYLIKQDYQLTDKDVEFYKRYEEYYE